MAKPTTIWRDTGTGETDNSNDGNYLATSASDDLLLTTGGTDRLLLGATRTTPKASTTWGGSEAKAATAWRERLASGEFTTMATSYLVTELGDSILLTTGGPDKLLLGESSYAPKSPTSWNDADFDSVIYTLLTDETGAVLTDETGAQLYLDYTDTKETTVWRPDNGSGEVSNASTSDYLQIDGTNYLILSTGGTDKLLLGTTVITIKAQTNWTRSDT